jgi:hypothetical protein
MGSGLSGGDDADARAALDVNDGEDARVSRHADGVKAPDAFEVGA